MSETKELELKKLRDYRTLKNQQEINGKWKLTYDLVNSEGLKGFSGKSISSYTDALTGKVRHLFDINGSFRPSFLITRVINTYHPTTNPEDRLIIDWLLGHPDIGIEKDHSSISKKYLDRKNPNPRFKLVNLDHISTVEIEDEDFIDRLIGRLVLEGGRDAIGIEKHRYILSALNRPYFDSKNMGDKQKEKKFLRREVKNYVRKSKKNAEKVQEILSELDVAKYTYEIKEMSRHEILFIGSGMYKYNGIPLGTSIESVIIYFRNNIEIYNEASKLLYEKLKSEFGY